MPSGGRSSRNKSRNSARRGRPGGPVLSDHRGPKRRMLPPLMQHGPMVARSWHRQMLPDFLWIALMLGRRSAWSQVYRPLDVVDRFVPDGDRFVDGRLSTFALV